MSANISSSLPTHPMEPNGDADDGGVLRLQGSKPHNQNRSTSLSVTIPIPKELHDSFSFISSTLHKLLPVEAHHVVPIFTVLFIETVFLKFIGWSYNGVLSAIFFTSLFGRFAWPVWCNLKRVHCRLDDVFGKIDALQQAIKSLESTAVVPPPTEYIPVPAVPDVSIFFPRAAPTAEPTINFEVEQFDGDLGNMGPIAPPVVTSKPPYTPYDASTPERVETPVVIENQPHILPPAIPEPVETPVVIENQPHTLQPATPEPVELPVVIENQPHTLQPATPEPVELPVVIENEIPTLPPAAPEPVELPVVIENEIPTLPPAAPEPVESPVAIESQPPTLPPATPSPDSREGVQLEGFGDNIAEATPSPGRVDGVFLEGMNNIIGVPDSGIPVNPPPSAPSAHSGVQFEGMDNIFGAPDMVPAVDPPPPEPPAPSGVQFEGMDNIFGAPDVVPAVDPPPPVPPAPSGVQLEGMGNIIGVPDVSPAVDPPPSVPSAPSASNSVEQPAPTTEHGSGHWLTSLREIKLQLEQATEGKIERTSHPDQPSISLSLRRWAVRLLMSIASLSPANFAPTAGFLGLPESTPYYPTGDLAGDRSVAFNIAMDCLGDLEDCLLGDDDVRTATKLFELTQALSDLGLREYALTTSGFALDALERPFIAMPNDTRLHLASVLSLRANILCDLKKNDEANEAAERAATLCREHRDSQTAPVPELAYALLNHAVILNSIGLADGSAAVAFELLDDLDESRPDVKDISALCKLCLSNARVGADDDMASSMAEETINLIYTSSDVHSQAVQAGAFLAKSKALSSREQSDAASAVSAEAVRLLRSMSAARPVFSLFLAHALDTHARHLLEGNRQADSYSIRRDAVDLWQMLRVTAGSAVDRSVAWSLFELSKFRHKNDRGALHEELRLAADAVEMFRQVEPLDAPGLGDALYLYADRMLELDQNQEAVTYATESVIYFEDATSNDTKYSLDLIFSLSLASACLACTDGATLALKYAKQAVEVQRGRKDAGGQQYDAHLRKLVMDVVFRATEMDLEEEASAWLQELQSLGGGEGLARRSGDSQGDEFRKQTSFWLDANTDASRSNKGISFSSPVASSSKLPLDKGKGKEVAPESGRSTPRVDKGKAKEVYPPLGTGSSTLGHRTADEEIFSPGVRAAAAAERRLAGFGDTIPLQGSMFGSGPGGFGGPSMGLGGGRTLGGSGIPGLSMGSFTGARGESSWSSRPGSSGTGI